jgi:serine-type D-Ala-D-Ala carboxypeptidase/endopeptidase (penicillin-binding protein 4)
MIRRLAALLALLAPLVAQAQTATLQSLAEAKLAAAPKGTRIGLVVTDEAGRELVAVLPDQRFIPASNTKMVTTATAFATMGDLTQTDVAGGTGVSLEGRDVRLTGFGDSRLSARPDCATNCLATLADAVAAKTRRVRDVIGHATLFADQRWSPGMSWNNIPTESGTANAALALDDNEILLAVTPAATAGLPPTFAPPAYVSIDNRATTVATGPATLDYDRLPFDRSVRLTGSAVAGASPTRFRLGVDDPAHFTASTFAAMLKARGVRVTGTVRSLYRPALPGPVPAMPGPLRPFEQRLTPPPLAEDIVTINKVSQNLHAELLLRRIGCTAGDCSAEGGLKIVRTTLEKAGLPRGAYDFSDGSGMSTYNRISPRGMAILLRWAQAQAWGKAWRDSLPVGGVDGTIAGRFKGTVLEGRIFAKTGGLNATAALSGYMLGKSGRTLIFSILANDIPDGMSARPAMDATLVAIADAN